MAGSLCVGRRQSYPAAVDRSEPDPGNDGPTRRAVWTVSSSRSCFRHGYAGSRGNLTIERIGLFLDDESLDIGVRGTRARHGLRFSTDP